MSEKNPTPVENDKGESATVPPAEDAPQTLPALREDTHDEAPSGDTVRVRVESPFWCTAFNLPQEDGGTLMIDRQGVEVLASDLEALIHAAAKQGVSLSTEVSN